MGYNSVADTTDTSFV